MTRDHQRSLPPRTCHFIAGVVGLLIALLALFRVLLPATALLAQFPQFSPLARAALLAKLLSPLTSFFLAYGWVQALLWLGNMVISFPARSTQQESQTIFRLERLRQPGEEGQVAVSPLFQLDPTKSLQRHLLPATPIPPTSSEWSASLDLERDDDEEAGKEGNMSITQAEQIMQSAVVDTSSQWQKEGSKERSKRGETADGFSLHTPAEPSETDTPVTLFLLKQMRVWVRTQDGATREVKLRGGENSIRLLILAFIAWRQGEPVDKDKMLTYVISRGKRRDMNTDQLGEVFDAAKKHLRQDLDRAVNELERAGHTLGMDVDIDFFSNESGFYWLHPSCHVADLAAIENAYQKILRARKEGLLDEKVNGSIPDWAIEACQQLIDAYPGDFLQELLEKFPEEFGSWVREPFTFYRDRYLDALLVMATYESALGRNFFDEDLSAEQNEEQRRQHSARAAQLFYDYAMYAINSTWDRKLKFAYRAGKDGERVVMSARAIRRCVVELGKLGKPDTIDQAYLTFKERMAKLSEDNWKPDRDTERDVADAKTTTSAYRFSSQIVVT